MSESPIDPDTIKALVKAEVEALADDLGMLNMIRSNTELVIRTALVRELSKMGHINLKRLAEGLQESRGKIAATKYADAFDLESVDDFIDSISEQSDRPNRPPWLKAVIDGGLAERPESPKPGDD